MSGCYWGDVRAGRGRGGEGGGEGGLDDGTATCVSLLVGQSPGGQLLEPGWTPGLAGTGGAAEGASRRQQQV